MLELAIACATLLRVLKPGTAGGAVTLADNKLRSYTRLVREERLVAAPKKAKACGHDIGAYRL